MAVRNSIQEYNYCTVTNSFGEITSSKTPVTYESVYIKIEEVRGGKTGCDLIVSFTTQAGKRMTKKYRFTPSVSEGSENFIKQGYQYLKTLPEFAGAVDC